MKATRLVTWLLPFFCLALIVGAQTGFDNANSDLKIAVKRAYLNLPEPIIPSIPALRALSLGHPPLVADLLWIQTIQYFGSGNPYGDYPSLGRLLDVITQLDPRFEEPYEFGLVVLPFMHQTDSAILLGERAQTTIPADERGYIDFYHASNYLLNVKDYKLAAKYYKQSSEEPNHPGAAAQLAGVALDHVNQTSSDRDIAINYWQTVEKNAQTDDERERASNWAVEMQLVKSLEEVAQTFKQDTGRYPNTLQELVDKRYIKAIPDSPVQRVFTLDSQTGKVSFDELQNPN